MKDDELALQLIKRTNIEKDSDKGKRLVYFLQLSNQFLRIVLIKYFVVENDNHSNSQMVKGLICCLSYLIKCMTA
jgi:hypothetical protein